MTATANQAGPHSRAGVAAGFREAREATGMSARELASLLGTSAAAVHDLETNDDELFARYSLAEIQLIAEALGIPAVRLLKCELEEAPPRMDPVEAAGVSPALDAQAAQAPRSLRNAGTPGKARAETTEDGIAVRRHPALDGLVVALKAWASVAPPALAEFEQRAGWRVNRLFDAPELLMTDVTLDALQQLCAAAAVDWRRVIASL